MAVTTVIHLVRHGAVEARYDGICFGRRLDPPLRRHDPTLIDTLLAGLPRDAPLISSPARRARETASLLAADFTIDPRWSERDFGSWEGRRWADCWADIPEGHLDSADTYVAFEPPGAESHAAVLARVEAAMTEITTTSVVVTHAGTVRAALMIAGLSATAAHAIPVPNLSVTRIGRHRSSPTRPSSRWDYCDLGR